MPIFDEQWWQGRISLLQGALREAFPTSYIEVGLEGGVPVLTVNDRERGLCGMIVLPTLDVDEVTLALRAGFVTARMVKYGAEFRDFHLDGEERRLALTYNRPYRWGEPFEV